LIEISIKGRRFCVGANIIKNATDELKNLSQNGFQECFQHLYGRWQKCILAQVDCFWRKRSLNCCTVRVSKKLLQAHFETTT
jgi:hypothetical protein